MKGAKANSACSPSWPTMRENDATEGTAHAGISCSSARRPHLRRGGKAICRKSMPTLYMSKRSGLFRRHRMGDRVAARGSGGALGVCTAGQADCVGRAATARQPATYRLRLVATAMRRGSLGRGWTKAGQAQALYSSSLLWPCLWSCQRLLPKVSRPAVQPRPICMLTKRFMTWCCDADAERQPCGQSMGLGMAQQQFSSLSGHAPKL